MSNEKEVKSVFAIDPATEKGDVTVSQSVYKAGEDFTPGGFEDILVRDGVISVTTGDLKEKQEGPIEVTFTGETPNPLYWETEAAKAFPIPSTKSLLSPLERGLEESKTLPPSLCVGLIRTAPLNILGVKSATSQTTKRLRTDL